MSRPDTPIGGFANAKANDVEVIAKFIRQAPIRKSDTLSQLTPDVRAAVEAILNAE
jgi:hypothetical protein